MGVEFDISYIGLPIAGAYARVDQFYVAFPATLDDPATRASATAHIFASLAAFSAGAPPLPGTVQLGIDVVYPIPDESGFRSEFDAELLEAVSKLSGYESGKIVPDPPPPPASAAV